MLPEAIVTAVAAVVLVRALDRAFPGRAAA
jgi:hypothetical protein